jgi:hypothetical protein
MTYTQALTAVLDRLTALEALIDKVAPNPVPDLVEIDTRIQALQGKLTPKITEG